MDFAPEPAGLTGAFPAPRTSEPPAAPAGGRLDRISKSYAGQPVLQELSLEVRRGEFVSLIGPSGCGKSTVLRLWAGLDRPDRGTVEIAGEPPARALAQRQVGFVFQEPVLMPWRTALMNVAFPLQALGAPNAEIRPRAAEKLQAVGLGQFAHHYPHQLSGGMRQRVAIARAMITDPAMIFMDEPFGALDEITRNQLNAQLLDLWQHLGSTVVLVTHSIAEAVLLSDRVVVMSPRPGRIAADIPIGLSRPRHAAIRRSPEFQELSDRIVDALEQSWPAPEPGDNSIIHTGI